MNFFYWLIYKPVGGFLLIDDTARQRVAPAIDGDVLVGWKELRNAAALSSVRLDVGKGSPSRV